MILPFSEVKITVVKDRREGEILRVSYDSSSFSSKFTLNLEMGTSLVAQWLRIRLPMQGTWVQSLVWEDPTCRGATTEPEI